MRRWLLASVRMLKFLKIFTILTLTAGCTVQYKVPTVGSIYFKNHCRREYTKKANFDFDFYGS
jgi:hypothetical protein